MKKGSPPKGKKRKYGRDKRYPGIRWYETKKGRVYYLYYTSDIGGRRVQREKRVGYAAEGWTAALIHEKRWELIKKFEEGEREEGIHTFKDAVDLLFKKYEIEGAKGIPQERSRLQHLSFLFERPFKQVLSETVLLEITKRMKAANQSATSIHHTLALFRYIINVALENDGCPVRELDPQFRRILRRKIKEFKPNPQGKTERLSTQQLKSLVEILESWPDRYHANIMRLALFTGMRRGNILKLEWKDIDWDRETIILRAEKTKGKRQDFEIPMNKMAREVLEEMKTIQENAIRGLEEMRTRALGLSSDSRAKAEREFLLAWLECPYAVKEKWAPEQATEKVKEILESPINPTSFVFPGKHGGQRIEIRKGIEKIRRAANLPEDFRPLHGLRHVYGTLLAQENAPFVVKELLGHASTETTKRYVDLADEVKKNAANRVVESVFRVVNGNQTSFL